MPKVIISLNYSSFLAKEPPPAAALKWLMALVEVKTDYDRSRRAGFKEHYVVCDPVKLEVEYVDDKYLKARPDPDPSEESELSKETQDMLKRIAGRREQLLLEGPKGGL